MTMEKQGSIIANRRKKLQDLKKPLMRTLLHLLMETVSCYIHVSWGLTKRELNQ